MAPISIEEKNYVFDLCKGRLMRVDLEKLLYKKRTKEYKILKKERENILRIMDKLREAMI